MFVTVPQFGAQDKFGDINNEMLWKFSFLLVTIEQICKNGRRDRTESITMV